MRHSLYLVPEDAAIRKSGVFKGDRGLTALLGLMKNNGGVFANSGDSVDIYCHPSHYSPVASIVLDGRPNAGTRFLPWYDFLGEGDARLDPFRAHPVTFGPGAAQITLASDQPVTFESIRFRGRYRWLLKWGPRGAAMRLDRCANAMSGYESGLEFMAIDSSAATKPDARVTLQRHEALWNTGATPTILFANRSGDASKLRIEQSTFRHQRPENRQATRFAFFGATCRNVISFGGWHRNDGPQDFRDCVFDGGDARHCVSRTDQGLGTTVEGDTAKIWADDQGVSLRLVAHPSIAGIGRPGLSHDKGGKPYAARPMPGSLEAGGAEKTAGELVAGMTPGQMKLLSVNAPRDAPVSYAPSWAFSGSSIDWYRYMDGSYSHALGIIPDGPDDLMIGFPMLTGHAVWAGNDVWSLIKRRFTITVDGAASQPTFVRGQGWDYKGLYRASYHGYDCIGGVRCNTGKGWAWRVWSFGAAPVDGAHGHTNHLYPEVLGPDGKWAPEYDIGAGEKLTRLYNAGHCMIKVSHSLAYQIGGSSDFQMYRMDFTRPPGRQYSRITRGGRGHRNHVINFSRTQGCYSAALDRLMLCDGKATRWVSISQRGELTFLDGTHENTAELFTGDVDKLPGTQCRLVHDLESDSSFLDFAERGLFAIDFRQRTINDVTPALVNEVGGIYPRAKVRHPGYNQQSDLFRIGGKLVLISNAYDGQGAMQMFIRLIYDDEPDLPPRAR